MDKRKTNKISANKLIIIAGVIVIIFSVISSVVLISSSSPKQSQYPSLDSSALSELAWSEDNLDKFLADENRVSTSIDAMNYNIDLYLGLANGTSGVDWDVSYSENDPYIVGIKEYVSSLENGRITNADELMRAFRVLQMDPPIMP